MPPKKDVKCYNRTAKSGATYTTCKDKKTGKQLRKGERPSASPPKPKAKPKAKSPPKSELEQRTGKTKAQINKMKTSDVVKFLPGELREKIASKMKSPKKKFDVEEIEDKLRKKIDNVYQDLIERFIDGRGSEEKQLDRASARAFKYIRRRIKQYAKEQKIKTTEDFVKKIKEKRSNFDDWLEF